LQNLNRVGRKVEGILEKALVDGWSKMFRCKERETPRNEVYFDVRRNDEG
jgi:hypothetical protein